MFGCKRSSVWSVDGFVSTQETLMAKENVGALVDRVAVQDGAECQ